uniref:Replisome organizer protein n=2 Tax=root TaxID=1 RepID=A0A8S5UYB3_9CAUD|nr:MAG TPA: replisome organizer protein [Siphoviridae sp. cthHz3]
MLAFQTIRSGLILRRCLQISRAMLLKLPSKTKNTTVKPIRISRSGSQRISRRFSTAGKIAKLHLFQILIRLSVHKHKQTKPMQPIHLPTTVSQSISVMMIFHSRKAVSIMNESPSYYAIIPAGVRYDKQLPQGAKLLYSEITALSSKSGSCWASDQYFMTLYEVGQTTIQRWLRALEDSGYIERHVKYKDGTKEIEKRYIKIRTDPMPENGNTYSQKRVYPMPKNGQENNTSINKNIRASSTLESDFEKLWKLYPKKIGKKPALAAYKRVISRKKNPATNRQIQDGIVAYRQLINSKGTEKRFVKDGSTFFNQESWNDYLEVVKEERDEQEARKPKFDPQQTAIAMYLDYNSLDRVLEEIKAQGIPIDPEDAKRYIAEYDERRQQA